MCKLYVVATPIGNLADISGRAIETLQNVSIIAAEDTRNTIKLLNHYQIKTTLTSYHKFNEASKSKYLLDIMLSQGHDIAIVSDSGTPCISDPGSIIVNEAIARGIEVISIPGPSAVITSLSKSGFEIESFLFYGFIDRNQKKQKEQLQHIRDKSEICVLYESPNRIYDLVKNIGDLDSDSQLCICRELTKVYETTYRGNPEQIIDQFNRDINYTKGEYCLIIKWSKSEKCMAEAAITLEAQVFDLFYQNYSNDEIITQLVKKLHKKNDIYKAILNVKKFINDYEKRAE